MGNFTRILISGMILIIVLTTYLASYQGWWLPALRNKELMEKYKKNQGNRYKDPDSRREFRSGTRNDRGK